MQELGIGIGTVFVRSTSSIPGAGLDAIVLESRKNDAGNCQAVSVQTQV
jgi:hypothetical protein